MNSQLCHQRGEGAGTGRDRMPKAWTRQGNRRKESSRHRNRPGQQAEALTNPGLHLTLCRGHRQHFAAEIFFFFFELTEIDQHRVSGKKAPRPQELRSPSTISVLLSFPTLPHASEATADREKPKSRFQETHLSHFHLEKKNLQWK